MSKQLNLWLSLPPEEQRKYNEIHSLVDKYGAHFTKGTHKGYENILQCKNSEGARKFIFEHSLHLKSPGTSLEDLLTMIVVMANQCDLHVKKKVDFINQHPLKIKTAYELFVRLNKRTITMGKSTQVCDKLTKLMGKKAASFHSKVNRRFVSEDLLVKYGIIEPSQGFHERSTATLLGPPIHKKIKCGKERLKLLYEKALQAGGITCVNSTMGFYSQSAEVGIVLSRSDSTTEYHQRVQSISYKGTIINLVLDNTSEKKWIQKAQRAELEVIDVFSIEELLKHIENE